MQLNISPKDYEYTALMDMLHVSVSKHLLDEHFTVVWANDFFYDMIDYPREEYESLYHDLPDLYYKEDPESWEKLCAIVKKTLAEGKSSYRFLSKLRRRDGEYIWVQIASTFVDEYIDGYQVSYTVMTDVNETIQMQREQTITYDNLPGFVAKLRVEEDFTLTLLDANQQFVDFFGEGCWQGEKDSLFKQNMERNAKIIGAQREIMMAGAPVHFIVQMNDKHGVSAWLQINGACVDHQGGRPVYLAIYIDITNETELRQMQQKLEKQAEELQSALTLAEHANRAKSDFLSHMSHDIRTPMNAIVGMTDIAMAHLTEPEKLRDCLRKISLSSQHLLGLINDVLDMSRIESGKMTISAASLSLPELLENVVAIIQPSIKARNQQFYVHLRHVRHELFISDSLRLRQIFINILSNASKFTPIQGSITMQVEELDEPARDPVNAMLRFTFSDSGIGMSPEFLAQLFAPFSRERDSRVDKTEGSGLGMAITKRLVDLLNGEITVDSQPGQGTTFCVTLPMEIESVPQTGATFPNLHVIVVDDDDMMCEYTTHMLSELGVHVQTAQSGREALALLSAAQPSCDAIFLDWRMPDMDGLETTRRIRAEFGSELPILIVSAYDWGDIEEDAQRAGVNGFLSKPLFASTLCRALRKYVLHTEPAEKPQPADSSVFSGQRFLLVEDNELNREIAIEMLTAAGAEMEWAANGAQGVEKFRQSPPHYYALILMDIQMPILNGYDATRQIRALERTDAKTVPILAMTADAFAEDIAKAAEAGMNGHLAKPLNAGQIKRAIQRTLHP